MEKDKAELALKDFATMRQKAVADGLESQELAALMVEKFAEGMRAAGCDVISVADGWCESIDPEYKENRRLRYERYATLSLTRK